MRKTGSQEQNRKQVGRPKGSRNNRRKLPAFIHPEQRLTIADMVELSGKSRSFFHNNLSLARAGRKHSEMPRVTKVGRNVMCRALDFFEWLEGRGGLASAGEATKEGA